jgi:predicted dinucleotide-binding enzyme
VIALIDELGFDGVDAGGLDDSWRQQPGSPCYGADLPKAKLLDALKAATPGRKPEFSK